MHLLSTLACACVGERYDRGPSACWRIHCRSAMEAREANWCVRLTRLMEGERYERWGRQKDASALPTASAAHLTASRARASLVDGRLSAVVGLRPPSPPSLPSPLDSQSGRFEHWGDGGNGDSWLWGRESEGGGGWRVLIAHQASSSMRWFNKYNSRLHRVLQCSNEQCSLPAPHSASHFISPVDHQALSWLILYAPKAY